MVPAVRPCTQPPQPQRNGRLGGRMVGSEGCSKVHPTGMTPSPTLISVFHDRIRARHYSPRTEEAYLHWVRRFVRFYRGQHPRDLAAHHVRDFLTHLATECHVSASTQNQALAAILFLYSAVLEVPLGAPTDYLRAKRPQRLPVVMTLREVERVLSEMRGTSQLMASLEARVRSRQHPPQSIGNSV